MQRNEKFTIGITCGDINGIGMEVIMASLSDHRILSFCTPVIFVHNSVFRYYKKNMPDLTFEYCHCKSLDDIHFKQINIFHPWEEEVNVQPGQLQEVAGRCAFRSLESATKALKEGKIHAIVTAPIHKVSIHHPSFQYVGHTPYFKDMWNVKDVLLFMVSDKIKVGFVTDHVPISAVSSYITKDFIIQKLDILNNSLIQDFVIDKPKIAVLALNPHAGDRGLIGTEEVNAIIPAIQEYKKQNPFVFGPYPADSFFSHGQYTQFDAILAMYHDQGLIPFKSIASHDGVNYTAGLPIIRTSPAHGTAFDIAGKGKADASMMLSSILLALDIYNNREQFKDNRSNPCKRLVDLHTH